MAARNGVQALILYVACTARASVLKASHGQISDGSVSAFHEPGLSVAEEATLLQMRETSNQTRQISSCWAMLAKHEEVLKPLPPATDALWQKRLYLARQTAPRRTLVIFSGHYIPPGPSAEKAYMENLRYFLKYGACRDKLVTTLVVVGPEANVTALVEAAPHVTWLRRSPYCYDLEAYKVGLKHIGAKGLKSYDYFVFLNCGLAGPFLPASALEAGIHWSRYFTSRITSKVKLVGIGFNFEALLPLSGRHPTVMSMLLATDHAGLKVLVRHVEHDLNIDLVSGPALEDLHAAVEWPTTHVKCRAADTRHGDFVTMSRLEFINSFEVLLSQSMFDSGYSIAAIDLADFGKEISSREGTEQSHGDLLKPGFYLNHSTIGPFDAIFMKTTRHGEAAQKRHQVRSLLATAL